MKIFIILAFSIISVTGSTAQTKCKIKKAYAFYTISIPGMQMADENGNPIPPKTSINRFIYIEWTGTNDPEIETVLYNNKPLNVTLTPVKNNSVVAGADAVNNKDIKISAKKCNSLWKIELQEVATDPMPDQDCKNIIIKNKGTGNICEFRLGKETHLTSLPRY